VEVACCVGTDRSVPSRGGSLPPTHAPLAVLVDAPASGARPNDCAPSVGSDALPESTRRDSRHEGRGGLARELPLPASVRRCVMRAFASPWTSVTAGPIDRTRALLRARAPVGSTPFDACHADPPRVVAAGRAFTTYPPTSDVPSSPAGTLETAPSVESSSHRPFRAARLTPPISRPTTRPTDACAPARSSDSAVFRLRQRRRPTGQSRSCATPVKGWRSLDSGRLPPCRLTACFRLQSEPPFVRWWTRRRLAHRFVLGFCRGPRQAVIHRGLGLAHRFHTPTCAVAWPARVMRTTGFCHCCFNLEHPCLVRSRWGRASHERNLVGSAHAARPGGVASRRSDDRAPSGFTPPRWLRGMGLGFSAFPIDPVSRLSHHPRIAGLEDLSSEAHTRDGA